jgi:hypothetical protein
VHRSMVSTQTILRLAIIDSNLDRNRSINEANDRCGNPNEVRVSSVGCTSKSMKILVSRLKGGVG